MSTIAARTVMILGGLRIFLCSPSLAAESNLKFIRLSLDVPQEERPAYLCVVSKFAQGGTKQGAYLFSDLLETPTTDAPGQLGRNDEVRERTATKMGEPLRFSTSKLATLNETSGALGVLSARYGCDGAKSDEEGEDLCSARLSIPSELLSGKRITCAANSQSVSAGFASVAVVLLEGFRTEPSVFDISFSNTIAYVGFDASAVADGNDLIATVVGGHYLPGRSRGVSAREIELPLEHRCPWRKLRFPSLVSLPAAVTVKADSGLGCELYPTSDTIKARIPPNQLVRVFEVSDGTAFVGETGDTEAPLKLRIEKGTFRWRRHCLHHGECPNIYVKGEAASCDGSLLPGNTCEYTCRARKGGTFDLPLNVRFEVVDGEIPIRWSDSVELLGGELDSYVSVSDRKLTISVEKPESFGGFLTSAGVTTLNLTLPGDREVHRPINLIEQSVYTIPVTEFSCNAEIQYRYEGSRTYLPSKERVDGGKVVLKAPSETVSEVVTRYYLGIGYFRPYKTMYDYAPSVDFPGGLYGSQETALLFQSAESVWQWAPFFGFMVGQKEFKTASLTDEMGIGGGAFTRIFLGIDAGIQLPSTSFDGITLPGIGISLGVAGGYGKAIAPSMSERLPGEWFLLPGAAFSLAFRDGSAIRLRPRFTLLEHIVAPDGKEQRVVVFNELGYSLQF